MYKIILFWNDTVYVSDVLSVHHQEFKPVHTATKQILLVCLLASRQHLLASKQTAGSSICLTNACCCMYSLNC